MKIPVLGQVQVARPDIYVDVTLNSRKNMDPAKVKKLAESIKASGVIHPPLLIRSVQLGGKYEKRREPYTLIAGFRRQAALDILEAAQAQYSVAPADWAMKDALAANLTENLGREDLSTYEIATQCEILNREQGMAPAEIQRVLKADDSDPEGRNPLSTQHINNLIRCVRQLQRPILKAWQEQHPAASLRTLIKLSAEKDGKAQLDAWNAIVKPQVADGGGEGEGEEDEKKKPSRPALAALVSMLKVVAEAEGRDADWKAGATAALNWAAGVNKTLGGLKGAKRKTAGKVEVDADAAEQEDADADADADAE